VGNAVSFANFIFDDEGNGWAYSLLGNGLFKLDFQEGHAELVVKDEASYFRTPYIGIFIESGHLTLLPYMSKSILEYDINSGDIQRTPLEKEHSESASGIDSYTLTGAIKHRDVLYIFGQPTGIVVAYNTESREVEYHTDLRDTINKKMPKGEPAGRPIFSRQTDVAKVLLVLKGSGHLVEYDLETRAVDFLAYTKELETSEKIFYDGAYFWIVDKSHDAIRRWDHVNNEILIYDKFPEGFQDNKDQTCFSAIINRREYLLMLPSYANMAVILDKSTGTMRKAEFIPVPEDAQCKVHKYDAWRRYKERKHYILARFNGMVYEYNLDDPDRVTPQRFFIEDKDFQEYLRLSYNAFDMDDLKWNSFLFSDTYVNGDPARFFSTFLPIRDDMMKKQHSAFTQEIAAANGTSGQNVFEMCKKSTFGSG
jgi:hypothetical protein